jgi:hypothetical protein
MQLSPIVFFAYNRPWHTEQTLLSLTENEQASQSVIYFFIDGCKPDAGHEQMEKNKRVIDVVNKYKHHFKESFVEISPQNKGLANSVIYGINKVTNRYAKVIVLEDDLITSSYFLKYMNDCLDFYEEDKTIWSISGYSLPIKIPPAYNKDVYLGTRSWSWGYATWSDRWKNVDWGVDFKIELKEKQKQKRFNLSGGNNLSVMAFMQMEGKVDSWYIRWQYAQFLQNKYCLYFKYSLVRNIGMDGSGTHGKTNRYKVDICSNIMHVEHLDLTLDKKIQKTFNRYNNISLMFRIRRSLSGIPFLRKFYLLITNKFIVRYK